MDGHEALVPRWREWPGRNTFCCSGRLMLGNDRIVASSLYLAIAGLGTCFTIGTYTWQPVLVAVGLLFCVVAVMFLVLVSATDPGILPRRPLSDPRPEPASVVIAGVEVQLKVCDTCNILRPARCTHCSSCNNCVAVLDHHCGVLGTCIGERNYRWFILFAWSAFLGAMFMLISSALRVGLTAATVFSSGQSWDMVTWGFSVACCALSCCCGCCGASIAAFQPCMDVFDNATMKEKLHGTWRREENYYAKQVSGFANLRRILCAPWPAQYVQWQELVPQGHKQVYLARPLQSQQQQAVLLPSDTAVDITANLAVTNVSADV
eukprot:TRINITY_DN3249_c0_g1_i1.p1 TRINITY_DN3249_c0_g1~~TRINITY_DN3249_c0_g1_i1.p1  ORF type:complete len:321 (+),score=35.34 TRINITY_DN3249_c0_g1_i1:114-1076(+)